MNEKQRANLKPWQPGQSGNPSGRPKTALIREAFVRRADSTLPDCVRDAIEKGGFKLPRRATFADGMAAVIFASALKGNAACARLVHEICEGQRVVISDEGGGGPGQVAAALDKIRALYGLEKVVDVAIPVKALPVPEGADKDQKQTGLMFE